MPGCPEFGLGRFDLRKWTTNSSSHGSVLKTRESNLVETRLLRKRGQKGAFWSDTLFAKVYHRLSQVA